MSFKPAHLAPIAALLLAGGCETVHENRSLDPGFGESARYNAALHIIDPDPQVAADAMMPGSNGAVAGAAGKRYRTNTVKPIERVNTTTTTTTSGDSPR